MIGFGFIELIKFSSTDTVVAIKVHSVNQLLRHLLSDMVGLILAFKKRLQKPTHLLNIELFVPIDIKFVKILVKRLL